MDKTTQLCNEYLSLRDEMKTGDNQNFQIIGAIVAASTALLAAAFNQHDAIARFWIFMSVFVVTIPAYRLLRVNRRRTWRISTYMRVFLEPELESIKWETHLSLARASIHNLKVEKTLSSLMTNSEWFIIMFVDVLAAIAAGCTMFRSSQPGWVKTATLIALAGCLVWIYYIACLQEISLRRGGVVEKSYEEHWRKLKEQEIGNIS